MEAYYFLNCCYMVLFCQVLHRNSWRIHNICLNCWNRGIFQSKQEWELEKRVPLLSLLNQLLQLRSALVPRPTRMILPVFLAKEYIADPSYICRKSQQRHLILIGQVQCRFVLCTKVFSGLFKGQKPILIQNLMIIRKSSRLSSLFRLIMVLELLHLPFLPQQLLLQVLTLICGEAR